MFADLGSGQTLDIDRPQADQSNLLFDHELVARTRRRTAKRGPTLPERTHLYAYVSNNPVAFVDPLGLKKVCGVYAWLYAGNGWLPPADIWNYCVDEDVYNAAIEAAGEVVTCWWDCEVTIHQCAAGLGADAAGAATTLSFTHLPIPKPSGYPKPFNASDFTSLQRLLSVKLREAGIKTNLLTRGGAEVKQFPIKSGVKSGIAGVAIVEAAFSIYCGYSCNK